MSEDLGTLTVVTTTGSVTTTEKKSTGAEVYDIKEEGIAAKTIIEIDGDIITRVNESGAYAYHEDLFKLHRDAVKYATGAWRKRLLGTRDLIHLRAKLHRALLLVSLCSLIGSAAAWGLGGMLTAAFLGLSVLSFFFSTYLRQFNFKARR